MTTSLSRLVKRVFHSLFPLLYAHMKLMRIDYLIYSAHKTATSTIHKTLRTSGYRCSGCHSLASMIAPMDRATFRGYLDRYRSRNKRRLDIITVFREPVERCISSFFQVHGTDAVRKKLVAGVSDTVVSKCSVQDLQEKFVHDLDNGEVGRVESIYEICDTLDISVADLDYDAERQYGLYETDQCRLFTLRFDTLIGDGRLEAVLSKITGRPIDQQSANVSASKWYSGVYAEFKASLKIPRTTVQKTYEARREAIDLFYPGEYESLLERAFERYS